ncbi:transcriptional regulator family: Fungal Specific TF [Agaricus bisporus var. burnettii]|uniref:Transcriptional regulator family: Fungal Specific TF n=1 Tax=Agaricus bisporus var. burnettii TaxID=192524 RepID=A0A8H7F0T2_AGABI|nr:transcriptional regulator family: Fungal Specific TF [Agaricus bisporus var. burnettii]
MHPTRQHTSLPPLSHLYLSQPSLPPPHHLYPPPQPDPEIYADSEPDDVELHGPPKKKRRRQALSCTECKRRKIKCDRNQPCAPCSRRGEQAKCQWHVVEPIEKYVTRSEYDELKERVNQLSVLVNRLVHHPAASLGAPATEAVSPYVSGASYHPLMRPPQNYPQQPSTSTDPSTAQAPPQSHRYTKGEEAPRPPHTIPSPSLLTTRPPPPNSNYVSIHTLRPRSTLKKLPRADVHSGRASAPRSQRPSDPYNHPHPHPHTHPLPDVYSDRDHNFPIDPSSSRKRKFSDLTGSSSYEHDRRDR